ncbi:MAG: hypothetical protein J1E96_01410 [Ruminococcus sp.]|nr:hypothetical protein [Ruminococcus sp.]
MAKKKDEIIESEVAEVADDEIAVEETSDIESAEAAVEETAVSENEEIAEETADEAEENGVTDAEEPETVVVEEVIVEYDDNDDIDEVEEMLSVDELNRKRTRRAAIGAGIAAAGLILGIAAKLIRRKRK